MHIKWANCENLVGKKCLYPVTVPKLTNVKLEYFLLLFISVSHLSFKVHLFNINDWGKKAVQNRTTNKD